MLHPDAPWYNEGIALEKGTIKGLELKRHANGLKSERSSYLQQCDIVNSLIWRSTEACCCMLIQNQSGCEPLNLENGLSVNVTILMPKCFLLTSRVRKSSQPVHAGSTLAQMSNRK